MNLECVEIRGGKPLYGRVEIQGSKNAVLPILAACILPEGTSRIDHCPRIQDVFDTIMILRFLGCRVWWEDQCLAVDASKVSRCKSPAQSASRMRSSVLFLGALLGRMGRAQLPYPGGCVLGSRPIDLHIAAITELGAKEEKKEGCIFAEGRMLKGKEITLRFPSVGATENIILAAARAQGITVINNAAREPEIGELCRFLQKMGVDIREFSGGRIEIAGETCLQDPKHDLVADRIVAGTYLLAAAITGGRITISRMPQEHMETVTALLKNMGIGIEKHGCDVLVDGSRKRRGIELLETAPYPGFPTDLQSPLMALLAVTEGESRIKENIFEDRFKTAQQLNAMGANIKVREKEAVIRGVPTLYGTRVEAGELRGAAALFLAGLIAEGTTTICSCHYISRGYENICGVLTSLGAEIEELCN